MPKECYNTFAEAERDTLKYILQHYNTKRDHRWVKKDTDSLYGKEI